MGYPDDLGNAQVASQMRLQKKARERQSESSKTIKTPRLSHTCPCLETLLPTCMSQVRASSWGLDGQDAHAVWSGRFGSGLASGQNGGSSSDCLDKSQEINSWTSAKYRISDDFQIDTSSFRICQTLSRIGGPPTSGWWYESVHLVTLVVY